MQEVVLASRAFSVAMNCVSGFSTDGSMLAADITFPAPCAWPSPGSISTPNAKKMMRRDIRPQLHRRPSRRVNG